MKTFFCLLFLVFTYHASFSQTTSNDTLRLNGSSILIGDTAIAEIKLLNIPKKIGDGVRFGNLRVEFMSMNDFKTHGIPTQALVRGTYTEDLWQFHPAYIDQSGQVINVKSFTSTESTNKSKDNKFRTAGVFIAAAGVGLLANHIRANNFEPNADLSNLESFINTSNAISIVSYSSLIVGGLTLIF